MKTLNISHSFTPIEISVPAQREWFVVFVAESQAGKLGSLSDLQVCAGDAVFRIHRNPEWPLYVLALPPSGLTPITNGKIALSVKVKRKTELLSEKDSVVVQASTRFQKIQALPAKGMFSVKWATKSRIAEAKRAKGKPVWAPEDFPLSHFDGASYLAVNASAREAVFSGKHLSGLEHFLREGKKNGLMPTISSVYGPNLGTREDLWRKSLETEKSLQSKLAKASERIEKFHKENGETAAKRKVLEGKLTKALERIESFRKSNGQNFTKFKNAVRREGAANETIKELKEENELLLFHLHQVQEELEKYFHNNKDLLAEKDAYVIKEQNFQADLSRLNSKHKELTAQREAFQKDLETAKTQATEAEMNRAELAVQLEASAKSQEAIATECVALKKDLEMAKTQATEAEMKCAELVSQIDVHTRDRDQNKKTANDRSARIAELEAQVAKLEAQVADQAELQKLIDEQMARADAQLELLKDFMRTDL